MSDSDTEDWEAAAEEEKKGDSGKDESGSKKGDIEDLAEDDSDSDSDSEDEWEADLKKAEKLEKENEAKKSSKKGRQALKNEKKELKAKLLSEKQKHKFKSEEEVVKKAPPKKIPRLYQEYNRKLGMIAEVEEFFGGEFEEQPIRIDLLEPKTETDFYEFSRVVAGVLTKFEDSSHYVRFLKDLNGRLCASLKKKEIQDVKKHFDTLMEGEVKKKSKKATGTNIMGTKSKTAGFEGDLIERAGHEDGNDSDSDFGDDDFM